MSTVVATLRKNLKDTVVTVFSDTSVLQAIGGKPPTIFEGKTAKGWFVMNLPGNEGIVISYDSIVLKERGPLGQRKDRLRHRFSIAMCSANWAEPVGATYAAADLAEFLRGSPTLPESTPNLRTTSVGNINGDDIYLRFISEVTEMAPNSTLAGGRVALIQTWETFPEVPQ